MDQLAHLTGLGQSAQPMNTEDVINTSVEPGSSWTMTPWLDAAVEVHGLPSSEAPRAPAAIRSVLEDTGAQVDRVVWGGGSEGARRGTIYMRWRPDKPYNAVDYANVARRLVARAAEGFSVGTRFVLNRYRIDGFAGDKYVYPVLSRPLPPSAPQAARGSVAGDLPAPMVQPEGAAAPEEQAGSGIGTTGRVVLGVGGAALVGGAAWLWWKHR